MVQGVVGERLLDCFPPDTVGSYSKDFARRAMADIAFYDSFENYVVVDVKTHNKDTAFNMPNLTSVERLARFYEDDKNIFAIMLVSYREMKERIAFEEVTLVPIEQLSWRCLTIGALGWGQIQIANSNRVIIEPDQTRKQWMHALFDALDLFYPREIEKITERITRFQTVRALWNAKD
jgi:hypothetical protein